MDADAPSPLVPLTPAQQELVDAVSEHTDSKIVFAAGATGAGKTHVAVACGLWRVRSGRARTLIVVLHPGSTDEMPPAVQDAIDELQCGGAPGRVETRRLSEFRGRTVHDAFVLFDDVSLLPAQLRPIMACLGRDSTLVMTGDDAVHTGFRDLVRDVGEGVPGEIEVIRFGPDDVVRSRVTRTVASLQALQL